MGRTVPNSAALYGLPLGIAQAKLSEDEFARLKHEYQLAGGLNDLRDNVRYGYIARRSA